MKKAVYIAAVVLAVLHHDFWWWDDPAIVLGFLPIGLAYHVVYTLLAAGLGALAIKFAWPAHLEEFAQSPAPDPAEPEADQPSS